MKTPQPVLPYYASFHIIISRRSCIELMKIIRQGIKDVFCESRHKPKLSAQRIPAWEIKVAYIGMHQALFKNSAADCFSDNISTGKLERERRYFIFLWYLWTYQQRSRWLCNSSRSTIRIPLTKQIGLLTKIGHNFGSWRALKIEV